MGGWDEDQTWLFEEEFVPLPWFLPEKSSLIWYWTKIKWSYSIYFTVKASDSQSITHASGSFEWVTIQFTWNLILDEAVCLLRKSPKKVWTHWKLEARPKYVNNLNILLLGYRQSIWSDALEVIVESSWEYHDISLVFLQLCQQEINMLVQ